MKDILKELYMGNVDFDSVHYSQSSSFVSAAKKSLESMEKLTETLNDYQKEIFESFCDAQSDIESITRYETFTSTLKFSTLLMIEVFTDTAKLE